MKKILLLLLLLISTLTLFAQQYHFYGEVKGKDDKVPLPGAIVSVGGAHEAQQTDANGHFHFYDLKGGSYQLTVKLLGYETYNQEITLSRNNQIVIYLQPDAIALNQVVVTSTDDHRKIALATEKVNKLYFFENNTTNFAKTLAKLPGVSSMDIGAGFSKPMIRGFGFNRIAVIDKGVSQQDQQWGADHGLEIDQFDVEDVVVHKGPMSLQFGSDAIGGAIEILPSKIPSQNTYFGDATFVAKSVNDLLGTSVMAGAKHNKWYVRGRYTFQRYGDYRVPTDNFNYLNTTLDIYNKRLKNTAGLERNFAGLVNYTDGNLSTSINISNVYQNNGFFAGAHGIPSNDRLKPDGDNRNIDKPNNNANHFKVIGNVTWQISERLKWSTDLGYQSNHRQELSYFHTHYINQNPPEKEPDLELDFKLNTYSFNTKLQIEASPQWNHTLGIQSAAMINKVKGYGFFLPKYDQQTAGAFWLSEYDLNDKWSLSGGARYDRSWIDITGFYDNILDEYLRLMGHPESVIKENAQRAYDTNKSYGNISASLGAIYKHSDAVDWKINIGKSFRNPTANELASNGIHHGAFRHEQGDPNLKPEEGYQLDLGYSLHKGRLALSVSPYVAYFSNYIFLEPQPISSVLPHGGQLNQFREARAFFGGGEVQAHVALYHHFDLTVSGQYSYNQNIDGNYSLPFSMPFSMRNELAYSNKYKAVQSYKIALEHQWNLKQGRIAANEDPTDGFHIFGVSANANLLVNKFRFLVSLQVQNILDTKYYNHLSFYRKIEIPEPGRNFQILIKIPFNN